MPQSLEYVAAVNLDEMFESHLAEIALDWVREPRQTTPLGGNSWSPANGFITVLAKSRAELIELAKSPAELIDLTALSAVTTLPAIDLTNQPVVMQHAA